MSVVGFYKEGGVRPSKPLRETADKGVSCLCGKLCLPQDRSTNPRPCALGYDYYLLNGCHFQKWLFPFRHPFTVQISGLTGYLRAGRAVGSVRAPRKSRFSASFVLKSRFSVRLGSPSALNLDFFIPSARSIGQDPLFLQSVVYPAGWQ